MVTYPKTILITGASSGIGEALALHYAGDGVLLALTGRNAKRLEEVAKACEVKGARVHQAVLDVTARDMMHKWIMDLEVRFGFDLVIANAGISGGTAGQEGAEDSAQIHYIFDVNVRGVFHTIDPVIPSMVRRGKGQIGIVSSLAGYRGFPGAPAYSASKAAVKVYGEGLRGALYGTGVGVSVICPGFVKSRMTDANDYKMPFMVPAEKAAKIIAQGLAKNKGRIAFPWQTAFAAWCFSILPDSWAQPLLRKLPGKGTIPNEEI